MKPALLRLADVPVGELCFMQERLGDDRNRMEIRETFYLREERVCRHPHFVGVARIGLVQGTQGESPRYRWKNFPPCRDPGEADGRVLVHLLSEHSVWAPALLLSGKADGTQ